MRFLFLLTFCLQFKLQLQSQSFSNKSVIDTAFINALPLPVGMNLSSDGNYVAYQVYNKPIGNQTFVIQSTRNDWKIEIVSPNANFLIFTSDNKKVLYKVADSLFLQILGSTHRQLLAIVNDCALTKERNDWIAYDLKNERIVTVINLISGDSMKFDMGYRFYFDGTHSRYFFVNSKVNNQNILEMVDLNTLSRNVIWHGLKNEDVGELTSDANAYSWAFTSKDSSGKRAIWLYNIGDTTGQIKVTDSKLVANSSLQISNNLVFSRNGRWLLFYVIENEKTPEKKADMPDVEIWSFKDPILVPAQKAAQKSYSRILDIQNDSIIDVGNDSVELVMDVIPNNNLIIKVGGFIHGRTDVQSWWWKHSSKSTYWSLSLTSGKRDLIPGVENDITYIRFSPSGRFVVYWDKRGFFSSYEIASKKVRNLTQGIPEPMTNDFVQKQYSSPVGIAGWFRGDSSLLIYGDYDIWKIDPTGQKKSVSITNGYGMGQKIKLRIVYENWGVTNLFKGDEDIYLTGLNSKDRSNGLFSIPLSHIENPTKLIYGCFSIFDMDSQRYPYVFSYRSEPPLMTVNGNKKCWVMLRHSFNEYPNYYFTDDFKTFRKITDFEPQKLYNWLTAELVNFRSLKGIISQGVLYKPENFNPSKKYPVIINFYEKLAQRVYQFPWPALTEDNINIPWFVSRGYLVFTPDINYTIANSVNGQTVGESAASSIIGAAKYLSRMPFVNANRIAIQGHSFGGLEAAFTATQSNKFKFAAVAEMAGTTDYLSSYLTLVTGDEFTSIEKLGKQDHPQGRMGATPWERPDLYRRNSAVLFADRIECPMLITHNRKDGSVNFRQGLELYMSLRRLGKPCWLLQYDNSGHSLNPKDAFDYTIRLTQYFDHYLKGMPPPIWMTIGMPASLKGRVSLYEIDNNHNCFEICPICTKKDIIK
jgi:dipeptidyl aminopeptidase/acylaminoacyl peptidase